MNRYLSGLSPVTPFIVKPLVLVLLLASGAMAFAQPALANGCLAGGCHSGIAGLPNRHAPVAEDCTSCHEQRTANHPAAAGSEFSATAAGSALCFNCHPPFPQSSRMHAPVAEGNCLACHRPHGASGPALLETSTARSQKPVCFQCHNQEQFSEPYGHGPAALGACTVCHDPHAAAQPTLLRQKAQKICLGCHADFAEGLQKAAFVHSAVTERDCTACHRPHSSARPALLKEEMRELCFGCHQEIREKTRRGKSRHEPLFTEGSCGNCHLIHYSAHPNLLFKDETAQCLDCHGERKAGRPEAKRDIRKEIEGKEYLHGPLRDQQCTPCHDPHGSFHAQLLKDAYPGSFYAPYEPGAYEFCFGCHDKNLLQEQSAATGFRNGTHNLHAAHVVKDVKGRTCMACHVSHAGDNPQLINREGAPFGSWRIPLRFKGTESGGSCMPGCHRQMGYDRKEPVGNSKNKAK
jgi:predicted CXXCH cytochrome family protein